MHSDHDRGNEYWRSTINSRPAGLNKLTMLQASVNTAGGRNAVPSYSPSPVPSGGPTPGDNNEETESWAGDSQIAYSCGRNSNGDADAFDIAAKQQLDFYFLYTVDLGVGGILDTRRFEISYVFNLASKLLLCTRDESTMDDLPYTILEVDSAQPDTLVELGLCSAPNTTTSDRLCHIIDGSLSIFFNSGSIGDETKESIQAEVTSQLVDIFSDQTWLSRTQPNILEASLVLPVTTSPPPEQHLVRPEERNIFSTSTIASFCGGLFASVFLLYLTYSRQLKKRDKDSDSRGKHATALSPTSRSLLRLGSSGRSLKYRDLDDMVLPVSDAEAPTPVSQVSFEPITVPVEQLSPASFTVQTSNSSLSYTTGILNPSPRERPPSSSDESVESVEDYSVAGGLHTIFEEEAPVSESFSF